jgi:hypothetical protein
MGLVAFASDIAGAQNEDEVRTAFRGYLRTQGSRTQKRQRSGNGKMYWSVNAYVGGQLGSENLKGPGQSDNPGHSYGPYIPLGVEVGVRLGRQWTLGALIQALDLGSIATYRSDADEPYEVKNDVSLSQVIVAGVGIVLGVGATPLSVGFITSYAPEAREAPDIGKLGAFRKAFVIGVDIPVFR